MHVLHVVDTLDHHPGRFAVGLAGLLAALRDAGVTSDVASGVSHDEWVERGLAADEIAIVDEDDPHAAMSEMAPLAREADVIHIHTGRAEIAKFGIAAARAARRPYVVSPWGELGWFCGKGRPVSRWFDARRFRRKFGDARAITCACEVELAAAQRQTLHGRTLLLRGGYARPAPRAVAADDAAEPMAMPWADGRPLAAMAGDIDGASGIANLLEALRRIPAASAWHFVIAGRPIDSWLPRYQQHIERAGLAEQVAIVVYPDVAQQAAIIEAAEFVLLAATSPTSAYGALQGLAEGKPVLVTQSSGYAALADSGAGLVAREAGGLQAGLERMLALSREERAQMGTAAAELVRTKWSWKAVLPSWLELYRSCG